MVTPFSAPLAYMDAPCLPGATYLDPGSRRALDSGAGGRRALGVKPASSSDTQMLNSCHEGFR